MILIIDVIKLVEIYRHDKSSDRRMSSSYQWDRVLIYIRDVIVDYIRTVRLTRLDRCVNKIDKYAECLLNMSEFITLSRKLDAIVDKKSKSETLT